MQFSHKDAGGAGRTEGWLLKSLRVHGGQLHRGQDAADRLGHPSGDVALAWLLSQPAATAPIVGPRAQEQLHALVRALDVELDIPTRIPLDEFLPGSRSATEEYAW